MLKGARGDGPRNIRMRLDWPIRRGRLRRKSWLCDSGVQHAWMWLVAGGHFKPMSRRRVCRSEPDSLHQRTRIRCFLNNQILLSILLTPPSGSERFPVSAVAGLSATFLL